MIRIMLKIWRNAALSNVTVSLNLKYVYGWMKIIYYDWMDFKW